MGNIDGFDDLLKAAQKRLKTAKTRVTIRRKRDVLYLRATLPPKPGSGHVRPHRYELPTSCLLVKMG
ncbi:MAG: hypothetical protein F6K31_31125 [Symploca sp. SIO2G7]|nr:hypothetical protein [Symploca sp. SIO2G7]